MKKKFVAAAFNPKYEPFVVHVATLSLNLSDKMHLLRKAQKAHLKTDETITKVLSKYADFAHIFSPKSATELFEYTRINDHDI